MAKAATVPVVDDLERLEASVRVRLRVAEDAFDALQRRLNGDDLTRRRALLDQASIIREVQDARLEWDALERARADARRVADQAKRDAALREARPAVETLYRSLAESQRANDAVMRVQQAWWEKGVALELDWPELRRETPTAESVLEIRRREVKRQLGFSV